MIKTIENIKLGETEVEDVEMTLTVLDGSFSKSPSLSQSKSPSKSYSMSPSLSPPILPIEYFGMMACTNEGTPSNIVKNRNYILTCPGTGIKTITELSCYCRSLGGTPGNIRLAIYTTDLSTLICQGTAEVSISATSLGWRGHLTQANITPNPATLIGGTNYVIVLTRDSTDTSVGFSWGTSGDVTFYNNDYTGGFPASIGMGSNHLFRWNVRCGVTSGAVSSSSHSKSPSVSPSFSKSISSSVSPSESKSKSQSLSPSFSPSESRSKSASQSPSGSPSESKSKSPSVSSSISPSEKESRSLSPSVSSSGSPSESKSKSQSLSPSASLSISASESPSESLSESASVSPSVSPSGGPLVPDLSVVVQLVREGSIIIKYRTSSTYVGLQTAEWFEFDDFYNTSLGYIEVKIEVI